MQLAAYLQNKMRGIPTSLKFLILVCLTLTSCLIKPADSRGGHREFERKRRLHLTMKASKNMFPSVVSIQTYNLDDLSYNHICGGTIISKRWVLTVAHCFLTLSKNPQDFTIRYGSNLFENSPTVNVEKIIPHPGFRVKGNFVNNDIAMLKTIRDFRDDWSAVKFSAKSVGLNKNVTVSGWGLDSDKNYDRTLKYGFMFTKKCPEEDHLFFICGQGARVVTTADSGGPMFYNNALVGITSFHIITDAWYGFFTDVNHYTEWIAETMKTK